VNGTDSVSCPVHLLHYSTLHSLVVQKALVHKPREQGAKENIWIYEKLRNRALE